MLFPKHFSFCFYVPGNWCYSKKTSIFFRGTGYRWVRCVCVWGGGGGGGCTSARFKEEEIKTAINKLKNNKEAGVDNIMHISNQQPVIYHHYMLNMIFDSRMAHRYFYPNFEKQSKPPSPENYWPITLLCCSKHFTIILNDRLNVFMECVKPNTISFIHTAYIKIFWKTQEEIILRHSRRLKSFWYGIKILSVDVLMVNISE